MADVPIDTPVVDISIADVAIADIKPIPVKPLEKPKKIKADAPKVIVVEQLSELGRINLANNQDLAINVANQATAGEVHEEGRWVQNPGGEWPIEKLATGTYKVTHNWGYSNISLSVNILLTRGIARVAENGFTYFIVETLVDGMLTDAPFNFSLVKVISPPQ